MSGNFVKRIILKAIFELFKTFKSSKNGNSEF
jgi:hypothetical protein